MLSRLKKPVAERDRVVIVDSSGSADIATVYDTDDQALYAASPVQDYAIPLADARPFIGTGGRIYIFGGDPDYVSDTVRLAALEKSIVLSQVTHYVEKKETLAPGVKIKEILLYVLVAVLLLAVVFK